MTPKQILRITFCLLTTAFTCLSVAAPNKDAATLKKIDEAVNEYYIAAQFDKAEEVLLAAIKACGTKSCSGEVIAKAYIYVGVVRGNGKQDIAGARRAFENAQAADPNVTLDATLVTPAVMSEFNKVMGKEKDEAPKADAKPKVGENPEATDDDTEPATTKKAGLPRVAPVGDLRCSPATGYEIQTARPIPINCEKMAGVVRGELYYKPIGSDEYAALLMKFDSATGTLRAQVPCEALGRKGTLNVYVIAQDENKDMVDTFGNALSPVQYTIVEKTKQAAPSYPGEKAPSRCSDVAAAESTGAGAGEVCTADGPCKKGLYCHSGVCRKTPSCEANADCDSNHCTDGLCEMPQEYASSKAGFNRWMVGVNFAFDGWISGASDNVCGGNNAANGTYNCYNADSTRINISGDPALTNNVKMADEHFGGNVKTTLIPATLRALASLDYALTRRITAGTRLGFAFNGGPATIHYELGQAKSQNKNFFPVHAELRAAYWFTPLDMPGLHPYLGLAFGMAEVDGKVRVTVYNDDAAGKPTIKRSLDAWRKMGRSFGALTFGGLYNLANHHNIQLNFNLMYMMPASGIVIEPSLGYVLGF